MVKSSRAKKRVVKTSRKGITASLHSSVPGVEAAKIVGEQRPLKIFNKDNARKVIVHKKKGGGGGKWAKAAQIAAGLGGVAAVAGGAYGAYKVHESYGAPTARPVVTRGPKHVKVKKVDDIPYARINNNNNNNGRPRPVSGGGGGGRRQG
jgi:hypothetical protein